jgi:hypothetical protein
MAGFTESNEAIARKIAGKWFDKMKSQRSNLDYQAKKSVKDAVISMRAYDTGELHRKTDAKLAYGDLSLRVEMFTDPSIEYAETVRKGFKTNRKYGKRDYLQRGMGIFLQKIQNIVKGVSFTVNGSSMTPSELYLQAGSPRQTATRSELGLSAKGRLRKANRVAGVRRRIARTFKKI